MPDLTPEQLAEAQLRAQQDYFANETRQLLEMAKMARANCLAATPQAEPVRQVLYNHFMACAGVFFKPKEPTIDLPNQ